MAKIRHCYCTPKCLYYLYPHIVQLPRPIITRTAHVRAPNLAERITELSQLLSSVKGISIDVRSICTKSPPEGAVWIDLSRNSSRYVSIEVSGDRNITVRASTSLPPPTLSAASQFPTMHRDRSRALPVHRQNLP
jgi:hypothetical protein